MCACVCVHAFIYLFIFTHTICIADTVGWAASTDLAAPKLNKQSVLSFLLEDDVPGLLYLEKTFFSGLGVTTTPMAAPSEALLFIPLCF